MEIISSSKVNIVLDASKIDLFETCPCRYNYRHNLNKTLPIIQKARALDLGSLAHAGLEIYYKLLSEGKHYDDRMNAAQMKIREMASDAENSNAEPDEVNTILSAVEESCDYWRNEDENSLEVLAVEQPFAYELFSDDSIRIIISGKIDLLANINGIGRASSYKQIPFDHKTFTRSSIRLRKSNQFINYCNATNSDYLIVNEIGLQKTLKSDQKFKRIPLSYDPIYISSWKNNLIKMILNEYLTCISENYWPEKPTSCNKFNRLCEYYEICDSSGEEAKKFKLENNYIDAIPWDVTAGLGDKNDERN